MEFPAGLRECLEQQASRWSMEQLREASRSLSERYRQESGAGKKLVTRELETVVYSLVRMPATFGAVSQALSWGLEYVDFPVESLLDVGAGTGAATWAADALLSLKEIHCLEREKVMGDQGQKLMAQGGLSRAVWRQADLVTDPVEERADLVIASYVLNELTPADREKVLKKLWRAAGKILLIVEPGTPVGFAQLRDAREILLREGAHLAAPCPHQEACRLEEGDWCHFTARVARGKLHKLLKEGDVPYEDEKFSYLFLTKEETGRASARILRHPVIEKGQVTLELCGREENRKVTLRKKEGELFRAAKKAKCGDAMESK